MATTMPNLDQREEHLRKLAEQLLFSVEKCGERFTLTRTADVESPARNECLTIEQAEELLGTWKLRGNG